MHEPINRVQQLEARIHELEAELAQSNARVAELEKRWEQWLKLISHDFRGPLTLMLGYTQTLLHSLPAGASRERDRHDLKSAVHAAQRLEKMIGEIVDAARLEANLVTPVLTEIDLGALVRDQIQKARRRYPGRSIVTDIPDTLPLVTGDVRRIGQIIATLLSNAILFSPATTPVTISIQCDAHEAQVSVSDQGIGLTDEEKCHLYERFYRQERARDVRREGLGLSLLVAAQFAEMLDGHLWA